MFRLTLSFTLVVCMCVFVADVDGGWFRRRRRRTVIHQTVHHHHVNNCNCTIILQLMKEIKELKKKLGRRDVAAILSLDEDYPGLDEFVDHLNAKRGVLDTDDLEDVIKRATQYSSSNGKNVCHCGRSLVDHYRLTE